MALEGIAEHGLPNAAVPPKGRIAPPAPLTGSPKIAALL